MNALAADLYLPPGDHRRSGEGDQLTLAPLMLSPMPRGVDRHALDARVTAELERIRRLLEIVQHEGRKSDPKMDALRALLAGPLAQRKVIVFSEFRETASYLFRALAHDGHSRLALIHGGRAWVSGGPMTRQQVVSRFAPLANLAPVPRDHEKIDVLIATDVLSEGLNLQDAEAVVSYDLPWNPVRLVQRLGRIERLGSPHPRVWSYNFLPDRDLDVMLRLLARIRRKLAAIRLASGGAGPVGGRDRTGRRVNTAEPPAAALPGHVDSVGRVVRRIVAGDPALFNDIERDASTVDRLDARLQAALDGLRSGPELRTSQPVRAGALGSTSEPAGGEVLLATAPGTRAWGVIAMRGGAPLWLVVDAGTVRPDRDAVLEALLDAAEGSRDPSRALAGVSGASATVDEAARVAPNAVNEGATAAPNALTPALEAATPALEAARRALDAASRYLDGASDAVAAAAAGSAAERRVARAVLSLLAAIPDGPGAALCARADGVLLQLRRGLRAGSARRLLDIARAANAGRRESAGNAERALDRMEAELREDLPSDAGDAPVIIAMLPLCHPPHQRNAPDAKPRRGRF